MPFDSTRTYALLSALAAEADRAPVGARTLLVAPTRGEGREILRALARHRGKWLGLEVTTVRPLALELVGDALGDERLTLLDEFAEQALIDELLDESLSALVAAGGAAHLQPLAEGVGFRKAVRDAVGALRLAGIRAHRVTADAVPDRGKSALVAGVLAGLEKRLRTDRLADTADLLARAAAALGNGEPLGADRVLLVPGLGTRGMAGRFLAALEARGAGRLPHDPVRRLSVPAGLLWRESEEAPGTLGELQDPSARPEASAIELSLFRAAGITEELREVLRRVVQAKACWDEVEIVTPDPAVYGPALHALAARLDIPVTFAVGLPVERTRAGRAVAAWLRWVQEGFPEPVLRRLLESGDLAPPRKFRHLSGAALARRLRRLRIGWGRDRYATLIEATRARLATPGARARRGESTDDAAIRHERELDELDALRALIVPIVQAVPLVPERHDADPVPVAPGALASGLAVFLGHVPEGGSVDRTALERLHRILDRAAATLTRVTAFPSAVTVLAEHLAIRIPAPRAEGRAPWGSDGGHLHLADIEHGGWTGRRLTFVVGLDAARFPGVGSQDPILLDAERGALARGDLPTSGDRLDERRFRMAALLARLRGSVTLSYAAWEPLEGRSLTPSPLLLQAFRRTAGEPDAGFEEMERRLGDPLSRIPRMAARLDAEDVWLATLHRDGRLLDGEAAVRASFAWLASGLDARASRAGDGPGPHHGVVAPRARLDPRTDDTLVLSSRRLESLGSCALRYFYRYVLGVAPADDPLFDPERWLDPLRKGSLLHAVYDRALGESKEAGITTRDPRFLALALDLLQEEAESMRLEVPPPSRVVYDYELGELRDEVRSFVGMVERDLPDWEATELRFGFDDAAVPPVEIPLPSGRSIKVRGAIDRVDALPSGGLRVVDYKTGSPALYGTATVWNEGRRLQHLIYTEVAERVLGRPVDRMEYHFPTRKGQNSRSHFTRAELRDGLDLIDRMLDVVAAGHFVPTPSESDCRWCDFKHVCRVRVGEYGKIESSLAAWAGRHLHADAFAEAQLVRLFRDRSAKKR